MNRVRLERIIPGEEKGAGLDRNPERSRKTGQLQETIAERQMQGKTEICREASRAAVQEKQLVKNQAKSPAGAVESGSGWPGKVLKVN